MHNADIKLPEFQYTNNGCERITLSAFPETANIDFAMWDSNTEIKCWARVDAKACRQLILELTKALIELEGE